MCAPALTSSVVALKTPPSHSDQTTFRQLLFTQPLSTNMTSIYRSAPLHDETSFILDDVEYMMMAGLGHGGEMWAPHESYQTLPQPPSLIPNTAPAAWSMGLEANWGLQTPVEAAFQYNGNELPVPFPESHYAGLQNSSSYTCSVTPDDLLRAELFNPNSFYPQPFSHSPAANFRDFDQQNAYASLAAPAGVYGQLIDTTAFFQGMPPYTPSPVPSDFFQLPPSPNSPSLNNVPSPTPSTAYSVASSSSSNNSRGWSRSTRSSSDPSTLSFLPSIRYAEDERRTGVFCAKIFNCKWGNCEARIELEGSSSREEAEFNRTVEKHINEHASPCEDDGTRVCRWNGGCDVTGEYKERRTMDRHIKSHISWKYFCEYCCGTYGRERARHLQGCKAYHRLVAAGEVMAETKGKAGMRPASKKGKKTAARKEGEI
ncbi:hypothetical protein FPV67DRAFT_340234 [Lyophyllum atratum]|nr:hypothetical protein FPV67DRAFT_340234 [Lyophyllum atratum]